LQIFDSFQLAGSKYVYLFTDGQPNDQSLAEEAGRMLRDQGINLIGVGIGNLDMEKISLVCGTHSYRISDYRSLFTCVSDLADSPQDISNDSIGIQFSFTQLKQPIRIGENLQLQIAINNLGNSEIVAGSLLEIRGGEFFEKVIKVLNKIPYGKRKTVEIVLRPTGNATIETLPEEIQAEILHPQTLVPYFSTHSGFQVEIAHMVGDIAFWKPLVPNREKANILIFGYVGAGKSTIINRSFSLWYRSFTSPAAVLFNGDAHVTTQNHFYDGQPGFRFLDTVGLANYNYRDQEFSNIVKGAKVSIATASSTSSSVSVRYSDPELGDEIHACIFVAPQGDRLAPSTLSRKLLGFIEAAVELNLIPILAVTKIDEASPREYDQIRQTFHEQTKIPKRDIFLLDHSPKSEKLVSAEKETYRLLARALEYSNWKRSFE